MRPSRALLFRLGAVLLSLLPFLLLELVLQVADVGRPADYPDPFAGFRAVRPLFVPSADGARFEIPPGRLAFFCRDSFAAKKPRGEFRVFCLGGSTVQGRPFARETAFSTWLELGLCAMAPGREFRVVNCGGLSYASYRLVPILEEVLDHSPDLIVIYTGHNEFLEDRTYAHLKDMPEAIARPLELFSNLRTFVLLREGIMRLRGTSPESISESRPVLPTEVDARLDHRGAMADYERDDAWRRRVIKHYAHSLRRMVALCRGADVPLILVRPAANLRDCPPFKSTHSEGLDAADLERFGELVKEARALYATSTRAAAARLREAIELDDEFALIHYELAKCLDTLGRHDEARQAYRRAREADICPLRMIEALHEELGSVAREGGVPLVDAPRLFEELSADGMPGADWFIDHVHPSIAGQEAIADRLLSEIATLGFVTPAEGWRERRERLFEAHRATLDDFYYARAQNRLQATQSWARGATKDP